MKKYYIVVTPFFPTEESFRGPFIYDQVKALKNVSNYEIVVFKPTAMNDTRTYYEFDGIKVYLYKSRQTPSYLFNGFFNKYNSKRFIKRLISIGIDIDSIVAVHCHTSVMGACGMELKRYNPDIKVFLQHHDKDPFTILNGKLANWKINSLYRAKKNIEIFNNVDAHICISNPCKENLLAFPKASDKETYQPYLSRLKNLSSLSPINPKKTVVLYNGVDISKFFAKNVRTDDAFIVGCIANFIPLKGQKDLIEAFAKFVSRTQAKNVRLRFVGSGPTRRECEIRCQELGITELVEFLKEVHHDKLIDFYNGIDLFVLPSYFDGFGCVCLEAYACGVPFMISENQGACDYLKKEQISWWSFCPGDCSRLSELIEKFYRDRMIQEIIHPVDINILVADFLRNVGL